MNDYDDNWTKEDRSNIWRIKLYHLLPCALMVGAGRLLECKPAMVLAGCWALVGFFLDFHADGDYGFQRIARINGVILGGWAITAGVLLATGAFDAQWYRPAGVLAGAGLASFLYLIAQPHHTDVRPTVLE